MPQAEERDEPAPTPGEGCAVELHWMPVGAGTSRAQQLSLKAWEAFEAFRCRRPRARLFHYALKLRATGERRSTVELTPAFAPGGSEAAMSGPVGVRGADRWRLFRYELRCTPGETLPDERWAVEKPHCLSADPAVADRILALAPTVPAHVWGRRIAGTREMWTSDSVIAWLLTGAGFDLADVGPPAGGRAPGWAAGSASRGR